MGPQCEPPALGLVGGLGSGRGLGGGIGLGWGLERGLKGAGGWSWGH